MTLALSFALWCFMGKFFRTTLLLQSITVAMLTALVFTPVVAQGPLNALRTLIKPVEADPQKDYALTEMDGPYLIFAAALSGPNAQQDAHSLVLELRKNHKWNAFVYNKTFVFNASQDFKQARNPYTGRKAVYQNSGSGTEFAVLIGNFSSLDDKQLDKTLAEVRQCQPASLKGKASPTPFSMAFPLANPLLPPEQQRGVVDSFIESLNKQRPYSLLRNPRNYTVQIATFTGEIVYQNSSSVSDKFPAANQKVTALEQGEHTAVTLCQALRERGVEAYEFHDNYGSIVTVGSFDQDIRRLPNGAVALDPQVEQTIKQYQGKVINGIGCDPQPRVIEVPRLRR
jgi:hypothetical protein